VQEVRQLEDVTGITLLATRPDGTVTLTPDGEQFARSVRPVPESLARTPATHHERDHSA
jgi:DNA-binding transcriptional LysR family regulator